MEWKSRFNTFIWCSIWRSLNNKGKDELNNEEYHGNTTNGRLRNPATSARLVCGNDMEVDADFWATNGLRACLLDFSGELEFVCCLACSTDLRAALPASVAMRRSAERLLLSGSDQGKPADERQDD